MTFLLKSISENFENYFGKFGRIVSINSLEIIEKHLGSFRELGIKENFEKYFGKFLK